MIRFSLNLRQHFGSSNILLFCAFSLIGILPNRIIQPIAQHSEEYPVERLGMGLLLFKQEIEIPLLVFGPLPPSDVAGTWRKVIIFGVRLSRYCMMYHNIIRHG